MEIIVSVFAAVVAAGCLLAVVKSDFQAKKEVATQKTDSEDS